MDQRWSRESRNRALGSDDSEFSLYLVLSLKSNNTVINKSACIQTLISKITQAYHLRCKAWSLEQHLEIHRIYIMIPEYSLKQRIKYCDWYRSNTIPSNIALWVEAVAVKLQKHLGSVRWPVISRCHPHKWKAWASKQTSGISKTTNEYQSNQYEIRSNLVMQWVALFWQCSQQPIVLNLWFSVTVTVVKINLDHRILQAPTVVKWINFHCGKCRRKQ